MKLAVLALEGAFDTGLSTVLDTLSTANELSALHARSGPHFDVRIVGVRRRVHSAQRLGVPVMAVADCPQPDCVIVPALGYKMPVPLQLALARNDVAEAIDVLRRWAAAGTRIAAACIGTLSSRKAGFWTNMKQPPRGGLPRFFDSVTRRCGWIPVAWW